MAAMPPKHVAMNHQFVALNIVCFIVIVYDVNLYIIRRVLLSIIRSLFTVHSAVVYVLGFVDSFRAGAYAPARKLSTNLYDMYHC